MLSQPWIVEQPRNQVDDERQHAHTLIGNYLHRLLSRGESRGNLTVAQEVNELSETDGAGGEYRLRVSEATTLSLEVDLDERMESFGCLVWAAAAQKFMANLSSIARGATQDEGDTVIACALQTYVGTSFDPFYLGVLLRSPNGLETARFFSLRGEAVGQRAIDNARARQPGASHAYLITQAFVDWVGRRGAYGAR